MYEWKDTFDARMIYVCVRRKEEGKGGGEDGEGMGVGWERGEQYRR